MKKSLATFGIASTLVFGAGVGIDQQIDPYVDNGTHHEFAITSEIPQGERVEIMKDKAQMDIVGWNDEYRISIKPQIPTQSASKSDFVTQADRPMFSKKMEYKSGDITAFVEPRNSTEFDIDFTLDSKPETNVFEYKIEGAEEFDFFYQPPLTQEEIDEGASRPDVVVGSYAVYHKTKANHKVGETNYGTGKAFHIYRPKAIDVNNNEEWAELDYNNGVLSVTVSQSFLDNATYPVVVDPTFGYTSQGASSWGPNSSSDYILAMRGTSIEGTVTQVAAYVMDSYTFGDTTTRIRMSGESGGFPTNTYVVDSGDIPISGNTYSLKTYSTSYSASSANWWVSTLNVYLGSGGGTNTAYDSGSGDSAIQDNGVWGSSTNRFSIYATYTASGGGGSNSSESVIWFNED